MSRSDGPFRLGYDHRGGSQGDRLAFGLAVQLFKLANPRIVAVGKQICGECRAQGLILEAGGDGEGPIASQVGDAKAYAITSCREIVVCARRACHLSS